MLSKMIAGCTRVVGKAQGYAGLPIRDEPSSCSVNGQVPTMVTAWEPTPAEMKALSEGGAVYIAIHGELHPPVRVWAGPQEPTQAFEASREALSAEIDETIESVLRAIAQAALAHSVDPVGRAAAAIVSLEKIATGVMFLLEGVFGLPPEGSEIVLQNLPKQVRARLEAGRG